MTVVTPTDRPKSVRNCCLIELFCGVVCVVTLPLWHFCWYRDFCHRTESDLLLFVFRQDISSSWSKMSGETDDAEDIITDDDNNELMQRKGTIESSYYRERSILREGTCMICSGWISLSKILLLRLLLLVVSILSISRGWTGGKPLPLRLPPTLPPSLISQ